MRLSTGKLTIGQKILLGYCLAMALMAITGFAGYRGAEGLLQANRWVRHTFLVIGEAQEIRAGLLNLENAGHGYVLSGDQAFLESTDGIRERLARNRKLLRELTMDNSVQQRRLDELDPLIERGLADLARTVIVRREKGFAAAQAALQHGASRERAAQMQNSLTVVEDQERTLLNERERRVEQSAQDTNQVILYGNLLGLLLAAFIGVVMHFSVTRPLSGFQRFVTAVGEGDLIGDIRARGQRRIGQAGARSESDGDPAQGHGRADSCRD